MNEKTAMQELIQHIKEDVELKMSDKKTAERLIWYIETYFIPKERQRVEEAWIDGAKHPFTGGKYNECASEYFTQKYGQQTPATGSGSK